MFACYFNQFSIFGDHDDYYVGMKGNIIQKTTVKVNWIVCFIRILGCMSLTHLSTNVDDLISDWRQNRSVYRWHYSNQRYETTRSPKASPIECIDVQNNCLDPIQTFSVAKGSQCAKELLLFRSFDNNKPYTRIHRPISSFNQLIDSSVFLFARIRTAQYHLIKSHGSNLAALSRFSNRALSQYWLCYDTSGNTKNIRFD